MIKVNEYRLGIIVMDVEPYDKIYEVDINMLVNAINGISYRPIPLTPEWLERCGFVLISEYQPEGPIYRGGSSIEIDVCYGYKFADVHHRGSLDHTRIPLAFVHQLQNLYFALTGEELNVKL